MAPSTGNITAPQKTIAFLFRALCAVLICLMFLLVLLCVLLVSFLALHRRTLFWDYYYHGLSFFPFDEKDQAIVDFRPFSSASTRDHTDHTSTNPQEQPRPFTSVSGLSSGADFALQYMVAFSQDTLGAGIFAGQPYLCAVQRFGAQEDPVVPAPDWPSDPGSSASSLPRFCVGGCEPGTTLTYDHCKREPGILSDNRHSAVEKLRNATVGVYAHRIDFEESRENSKKSAGGGDVVVGRNIHDDGVGDPRGDDSVIDDPSTFLMRGKQRVYLHRGQADQYYPDATVRAAAEVLRSFVPGSSSLSGDDDPVLYETRLAAGHAFPIPTGHWPCGWRFVPFSALPVQTCPDPEDEGRLYDGPGTALRHIYKKIRELRQPRILRNLENEDGHVDHPESDSSTSMKSSSTNGLFLPENLRWFDQSPFFEYEDDVEITGLHRWGAMYVPTVCRGGPLRSDDLRKSQTSCDLHMVFHGCGFTFPGLFRFLVTQVSFNAWAEENGIVVLYPRLRAFSDPRHEVPRERRAGCWDAYSQTGRAYASQEGLQMRAVRKMALVVGELIGERFGGRFVESPWATEISGIRSNGVVQVGEAEEEEVIQ